MELPKTNYLPKHCYGTVCKYETYRLQGDMLKYISIYRDADECWSFYPPQLKLEYDVCKKKHDHTTVYFSCR